ncbi:MAG: hypothetical protein RQ826_00505 [Xanthomonadales bacterium]|nr:hypothetical protein [Xanthomonadales bacterium]
MIDNNFTASSAAIIRPCAIIRDTDAVFGPAQALTLLNPPLDALSNNLYLYRYTDAGLPDEIQECRDSIAGSD